MQIFIFADEIKRDIVVLMLLSANNYVITEETIASTPMASLPDTGPKTVNPIMAIVLVCLLSAFFMVCVVSTYFRHYTERQLRLAASTTRGSEPGSIRSVVQGLDPAVIATFASFLYSSVKGIKIGHTVLECAVCLNEFQDHETLRLLPICSHVFHRDCIDTWLASHVTCPVCRADLIPRHSEPGDHMAEPLDYSVDLDRDCGSTEFLLPIESTEILTTNTQMIRSHSTGHSLLVRPAENVERYTLRLPNEARDFYINLVPTSLPNSPHMKFSMQSSEKMTFRSVSVGSTRPLDYARYERSNYERAGAETSRGRLSMPYVATRRNDMIRTSN